MINKRSLSREQVLYAINHKEFPDEVIKSCNKVVVIMTQDWCPQWKDLQRWVYNIDTAEEVNIYDIIYNKTDYFDEFRNFKENVWGNHLIPYLRYYKDGKLIDESNYVNENKFKEILQI